MLFRKWALAVGLSLLGAAAASAQDAYPSRLIKVIVPTSPGALTDVIARVVAQTLSEAWKQSVVVENRPGGDELLGGEVVAKAAPDGYTLLVGSNGGVTSSPQLHPDKRFDPIKDLTPVFMLGQVSPVMLVSASVPANNVKELIELAKSKPGQLNYGSFGNGSYSHVAMVDFTKKTGTQMMHVPYRGAAPAYTALLRNEVSVLIANLSGSLPHVNAGTVRIIAAAGPKRSKYKPDIPAVAETVPGFATGAWWGIFGPANLPAPVIEKVRAELTKALNTPEMKKIFEQNTLEPIEMSQAQFVQFIKEDQHNWNKQFKDAGLLPN
jgi:tripartite-type tricarboxylate transporter receptor subunit TctC